MSAKENGNTQFYEYNCMECAEIDDITMVQCDECDLWAHFRCVGVGPEIENSNWSCRLCHATLSGLSLTDKKHVDASVGTEADLPGSSVATEDRSLIPLLADMDAPTNCVGLSVATGAQALDVNAIIGTKTSLSDVACLKLVKKDSDLPVTHLLLDDEKTFEFYKTKLSKFGGSDINETVRDIGRELIADCVLMKYSYLGRRTKLRFKDFDNITKLVVASTIASMNRKYFEAQGEMMVRSDKEVKQLHYDVEKYFTKEYIKQAESRFKRSLK